VIPPFRLLISVCCATACSAAASVTIDTSGAPHMRPAEQGASSAVYFTLRNSGPDTLVLTGVEIDVAAMATIHRSTDTNGMASMVPQDSVIVPPNDSAVFAERGLHIMAMDLHAALRAGDTVATRLRFRSGRVDTLRVPVRE